MPRPTLLTLKNLFQFINLVSTSSNIKFQIRSAMKVVTAMKKLKFWSRKKRKKKALPIHYVPPPPDYSYSYSYYHAAASSPAPICNHCCPISPSAPPLPPWFDDSQTQEFAYATEYQFSSHETELLAETSSRSGSKAAFADDSGYCSYQQYTAPNPVYGLPVVQATTRRDKFCGLFGYAFGFGSSLIRCFCPCFPNREA